MNAAHNMIRMFHLNILLIYLTGVFAKITIPLEGNTTQDRIINCATEISNTNFNLRRLTVVLSNDVDEIFVEKFLRSYKGTSVIESKEHKSFPGHVIVIVESTKSFMEILTKLEPDLKGRTLLSSNAKFLLVLLNNSKKMESIFKFFWSYRATNTVIIANKENKVAMYTYYPYKNHLNCQNTEPKLIGYWKENSNTENVFPDKMLNMNGCPLYISTNKLYHPLTEQKIPLQIIKKTMIRLLRDSMNFTPIISTRDYISIDSDRAKNWSDSLNDVITGLANISTCSIPMNIDRMGLLDYSMPYIRVRLAWLAPPITPGPVWWRLLSPLNGYLWLILLILTFFVTILPFTLKFKPVKRFCYRYFRNIDKLQGVVIRIWGVMLGQPIRVAPRRFRDFYIIGLWMWFTFVIRNAYQSVLIGALKTDTFVGDFANLKEIIDSGYKYGGRKGIFAHFEHDPLITEHFEIIPEEKFEDLFRNIVEGREKFVLATSLEYAWAYCLVKGMKENECGHVLPDSILTVPLVVWTKIYSPFLQPLYVWIPRFIESGLLDRGSELKPPCCFPFSSEPTALTRHQVLSCILCLFIGYMISTAVFILELMKYNAKKFKQELKQRLNNIKMNLNHRWVN